CSDPLFLISFHFLFKNNSLVIIYIRLLSPHFLLLTGFLQKLKFEGLITFSLLTSEKLTYVKEVLRNKTEITWNSNILSLVF
ncbi:hypothetical protein Nmel_006017, partial [Mimus melanotis]